MYITTPDPPKKILEDFDFSFTTGMMLPITLDRAAGDTVDFTTHPTAVIIHLAERPSPINPDDLIPAEEITIFTQHILSIHKREREVTEATQEQKDLLKLTIQELGTKMVQ